jgi:hypothetical protein
LITSVIDTGGVKQISKRGILRNFVAFFQSKYGTFQVDNRSVAQMAQAVLRTLAPEWRDYLDMPITADELQAAVRNGACNKVPRRDGISLEFFKVNWDSIKEDVLAISIECNWTVKLWVHKRMAC